MMNELEIFDEECEQILQQHINFIEKTLPDTLYHYTGSSGLKGIIENGNFHFTNIWQLNDPSELEHGYAHARAIIKDFLEKGLIPHDMSDKLEKLIANKQGLARFFVGCFSTKNDDLAQWITYANNGKGYALGFQREKLEALIMQNTNIQSFLVTYDDTKSYELHLEIMRKMAKLSRSSNVNKDELAIKTWQNCITAAVLFKHQAYSHEHEYRFLETHAINTFPKVKLLARQNNLVEYLEFDWKAAAASSLNKIVIGPAADKAAARCFVEACLRTYQLDPSKIDIVESDIPYRS